MPSVPAPGAAATVVALAVVPGVAGCAAPTGRSRAYVGDVLLNITGPMSAGCFTQPSKRSVRYACTSASSNSTAYGAAS